MPVPQLSRRRARPGSAFRFGNSLPSRSSPCARRSPAELLRDTGPGRHAHPAGGGTGTGRSCSRGRSSLRATGSARDAPRGSAARCIRGPYSASRRACRRDPQPCFGASRGSSHVAMKSSTRASRPTHSGTHPKRNSRTCATSADQGVVRARCPPVAMENIRAGQSAPPGAEGGASPPSSSLPGRGKHPGWPVRAARRRSGGLPSVHLLPGRGKHPGWPVRAARRRSGGLPSVHLLPGRGKHPGWPVLLVTGDTPRKVAQRLRPAGDRAEQVGRKLLRKPQPDRLRFHDGLRHAPLNQAPADPVHPLEGCTGRAPKRRVPRGIVRGRRAPRGHAPSPRLFRLARRLQAPSPGQEDEARPASASPRPRPRARSRPPRPPARAGSLFTARCTSEAASNPISPAS